MRNCENLYLVSYGNKWLSSKAITAPSAASGFAYPTKQVMSKQLTFWCHLNHDIG